MRRAIVIGVAVLALSACGKKEDAAKTGEGQMAAATAPAAGPPTLKAGLWTQRIVAAGSAQTMKLCLGEQTADQMQFSNAAPNSSCSKNEVTPVAGGVRFESVCAAGAAGTVTTTGTATGDFASGYKVEATSTTAGAAYAQANGTHKVSIEARREGDCPANMKPGDIQLADGMVINPAAMAAKMGAMQGGK